MGLRLIRRRVARAQSVSMVYVKYIVKVRDNADHSFVHTFEHPTTAGMLSDNQQVLLQELMQTYRPNMMFAAPFRCVNCGAAATQLYNSPIAYLSGSHPVVFDPARPICPSSVCQMRVHDQLAKAFYIIGKGTSIEVDASGAMNNRSQLEREESRDLPHTEVSACVTCGDDRGLKKCNGCKVVPYCSTFCQKLQWPQHKAWCKAHRS